MWDYDGTLVDTRFADEAAVDAIVDHDPSAVAGAETFWAAEGQPLLSRLELAWPGRSAALLPLFDGQAPPRPFPGVADVIAGLVRRELRLAVVSSRRRATLEWGLQTTGFEGAFASIVGLDDVTLPKPDPEGLWLALADLGVIPERAVYVGDSDCDIEAGRRVGTTTWRAVWSGRPSTEGPSGDAVLHRPWDVIDLLERTDAVRS